jgi:hypothetical protein
LEKLHIMMALLGWDPEGLDIDGVLELVLVKVRGEGLGGLRRPGRSATHRRCGRAPRCCGGMPPGDGWEEDGCGSPAMELCRGKDALQGG